MASTWGLALCLCSFLLLSTTPSLASTAGGGLPSSSSSSSENGNSSSSGSEGTGEGGGHGAPNVTTLPIVTWKWHHVEQPYLVALWVLVAWLCKLGES